MFVENGTEAQVARLYQADLGRMPDLAGLEAWSHEIETGSESLSQVASAFSSSPEFKTHFGANLDDQHFVSALYQNVLGRTYDQAGFTAWVNYLQSETAAHGTDQARTELLLSFTDSPECVTYTSSWMVDTGKAPYHDVGMALSATTVLTNGETSGSVNLNPIDASTLPSGTTTLTVGGLSFQHDPLLGLPILTVSQNDLTVTLSSAIPYAAVVAARDTFITPMPGGSYIEIASAGTQNDNTVVMQGSANMLNIDVTVSNGYCTATPVNTTVKGYVPGSDGLYLPTTTLMNKSGLFSLPGADPGGHPWPDQWQQPRLHQICLCP